MPPLRAPTGGLTADLRGLSAELLITLAGLATSAATVALNFVLRRGVDLDLLSLTYVAVLPAGAIVGGIGAASGYYLAARATHMLPNRRMLFEMLAITLSTWFLAQWLSYALLRFPNGAAVRDVITFWDYFQLRTEHTQLTFRSNGGSEIGRTGELGLWGYGRELVQIIGFLLGGLLMWHSLTRLESCAPCGRYAKSQQILRRKSVAVAEEVLRRAGLVLPGLAEQANAAVGKGRLLGIDLNLVACPTCQRQWVRPEVVVLSGGQSAASALASCDVEPAQATLLHQHAQGADRIPAAAPAPPARSGRLV